MCLPLLAPRYPLHNTSVTKAGWKAHTSNFGKALSGAERRLLQLCRVFRHANQVYDRHLIALPVGNADLAGEGDIRTVFF